MHDRHWRDLGDELTTTQHDHHEAVLFAMHTHVGRDNCLEMIAVRGTATRVPRNADALLGT
ncbi:MAG: hypothetical protein JW751_02985 [Polyangiaceae bacterium]|nr:hypothetical protein [Polyangiaceae bacterium]